MADELFAMVKNKGSLSRQEVVQYSKNKGISLQSIRRTLRELEKVGLIDIIRTKSLTSSRITYTKILLKK